MAVIAQSSYGRKYRLPRFLPRETSRPFATRSWRSRNAVRSATPVAEQNSPELLLSRPRPLATPLPVLIEQLIILRQKTLHFRAGDEWRPGTPCGRLPAYRRACGNLRLRSGADTQGSNERVRRSRQGTPVRFAVFGPGIPTFRHGEWST